ncbi:MAG: patatin-like phospholipase family protein [Bacilli bacterium]|nr:patatin-like phospholipase family protein [Bacilli bacterium]
MRGLMLEGGGAKGAYEAGAVKALLKRKIQFDCIGGTSIGAINAAFCVQKNFDGMYKLWLSTDSEELFGIESEMLKNITTHNLTREDIKKGLSTVKKIVKNRGIDTVNIRRILEKNINEKKFRRSKIDFAMNTYSLSDRKPVEVFKKDIPEGKLIDYIISSAYLPVFKFERIIDDKYYIDGGFYSNCPVDMLVDALYDEIYVIRAWQKKMSIKNKNHAKIHIIGPREDLGSIMLFDPEMAEYRMNLGYYDTIKYLDNLDGNKYYFKNYNEEYYSRLFGSKDYKEIVKKYNKGLKIKNNKDFILIIIEKICNENKMDRFKVYNLPYLITRLKYKMAGKTKNYYYDFIKKIKVEF